MAYVSNAWKQTLRSKPKIDSPNTAGAPKVATVIARSRGELKEWGDRMNLKPGPRTMAEINAMSSQQHAPNGKGGRIFGRGILNNLNR
jgi:hypothetical protein